MTDAELVAWFDKRPGERDYTHMMRCSAIGMHAVTHGLRNSIEAYEEAQRLVKREWE